MDDDEERARVAALRGYGILNTPNEAVFDSIVVETRQALGMPIVLISLVDTDRQWFKAKVGLDAFETPRCISFCTHALRGPGVFVVGDAAEDERFSDNPLVTHSPFIRFYAGSPLTTPAGRRIGTLCVLDTRPHPEWSERESVRLARFAERTMIAIEIRSLERRQALAAAG